MKNSKRKVLFPLFMLSLINSAISQEQAKPQTKIEQLFLSRGSLLIKEFYALAKTEYLPGVTWNWLTVHEVGREARSVNGLRVEIVDYSRSIRNESTAFLDVDEVTDVSSALDYMINLSAQYKAQPPSAYTEAQFSTKGDFRIGFYCSGKELKAFISAGRVSPSSSFFSVDRMPDLKNLIEQVAQKYVKK